MKYDHPGDYVVIELVDRFQVFDIHPIADDKDDLTQIGHQTLINLYYATVRYCKAIKYNNVIVKSVLFPIELFSLLVID